MIKLLFSIAMLNYQRVYIYMIYVYIWFMCISIYLSIYLSIYISIWLVVSTYLSWKNELVSWDDYYSHILWKTKNVWNHQPDNYTHVISIDISWYRPTLCTYIYIYVLLNIYIYIYGTPQSNCAKGRSRNEARRPCHQLLVPWKIMFPEAI